jgi:hypothetical protein
VVQAASVSVLKVLPSGADVRGNLIVQATATAELKTKRPLRIFSGTYNARGRPERQVVAVLQTAIRWANPMHITLNYSIGVVALLHRSFFAASVLALARCA